MPTWNKLSFPDANSPQMEQILFFHDHTVSILILVITLIFYSMLSAYKNKFSNKLLFEAQQLETIWTTIPTLLIILIAFPSLTILYMMEESLNPTLSLKVIGHQWYWSYKMFNYIDMDVFMKSEMSSQYFRLLDTNQRLILPSLTSSQLLVTSSDVIHSWTIPALGVKSDATPGRINQITILPLRPGLFFGQCSEICGINHSFMPITLEIIPFKAFINWLKS